VTGFCSDGRAVIQPNFVPDTEDVLKVSDFPGSGGDRLQNCRLFILAVAEHLRPPGLRKDDGTSSLAPLLLHALLGTILEQLYLRFLMNFIAEVEDGRR
jgi:hypothetical protein